MTTSAQQLADRYAALWTERDAGARRKAIERLWAEDGVHLVHPPEEIRAEAVRVGFPEPVLEARGYRELEFRVARAYQEFVAPGEFTFRAREDAVRLRDVVRFSWEMVSVGTGELAGGGVEFVVLDADGRITADYQFPGL
ncbi:hypothetical protein ACIG0C_31235 [Kitasatospora aureofaciens]|uniref:SnoaL-like domain-containing protein n=1 Tax=Kitasatospora aureofaciens TaxID=1894 RepID=A0A1E7N052_KITAU|nr:hypothetical protein [Kitasatospora aureofaciens]ARF77927.1 hypothetical protein B6264_02410 [Kitasatospora aureofaciens]OEV34069.1 hypothetical protein HS99_0011560 [Kitasatospora aureofaciens]GGU72683.1 hypothetical protein GCM10010502_25350 [Kitasatospora aureofaciens]